MATRKPQTKPRSKLEPPAFRARQIIWPKELPENGQAAQEFWRSVEQLNEAELTKWLQTPGYVPIHHVVLLPPESGVTSPESIDAETEGMDALIVILAGIIAQKTNKDNQRGD